MPNIGPTQMVSDQLTSWDVTRCTTDKLEDVLNDHDEPWEVHQITHTGGRDWVVIKKCEWESLEQKMDALD